MNNNNIGYMINEASFTPKKEDVSVVSDSNNRLTIQTILQDLNVKNRNGRFYEDSEMKPELKSQRTLELLNSGNLFGEAGHPMSKDIARQQIIDPNNVSHKITKLWVEGNDIKAHVRGAANRIGEDFNNHILDGTIPSFSLRALGTIKNTSRGAEVKNIKIITWDWVIFPSHKRAYMEKVVNVNESVILGESNKLFVPDDYRGKIEPITNKQIIDYIQKESGNINNILESFNKLYSDMEIIEKGTKVRLMTESGEVFIVNLEDHIYDKIMEYCYNY